MVGLSAQLPLVVISLYSLANVKIPETDQFIVGLIAMAGAYMGLRGVGYLQK